MPRFFYSFFLSLLTPFIVLRLWYRSIANPAYRQRLGERFARKREWLTKSTDGKPLVLVHAVSVGEVMATVPLVRRLIESNYAVLVTTMTPTGSDTVRSQFGESVMHGYLPYDLSGVMARFLAKTKPDLVILMETELWPNLIYHCDRSGIPIVLANARLSEKSAKGYGRFNRLTQQMLEKIHYIAAQSEDDANRLIGLGADPEKLTVTGSLKFNLDLDSKSKTRDSFMQSVLDSSRPVIIAASTRAGEEEKILDAFTIVRKQLPQTLLIIVPRHLERFDSVAELVQQKQMHLLRRTDMKLLEASHHVFLGDSMGEMMSYYNLAKIAFVGGSLVNTGCQNVLEPAALGIPVLVGPSQYNFAAICQQLELAGGLRTVANETVLADTLLELLSNPEMAKNMGQRGAELVRANQQALPKLMQIIDTLNLS